LLAALVLALASLAAGTAGAATLGDIPSSVDQYVEIVPTGSGKVTPKKKTTPLPPNSAQALKTTDKSTAAALTEVATSSVFGAPDKKLAPKAHVQVSAELPNASFAGSLKETAGSLFSGGGRPLALLIGLVVITAAAVVTAAKKNRSAG
jgi:hypothetical protein